MGKRKRVKQQQSKEINSAQKSEKKRKESQPQSHTNINAQNSQAKIIDHKNLEKSICGFHGKQLINGVRGFAFSGKSLDDLLQRLSKVIEAEDKDKGKLNFNLWSKQYFSIGINDVTRMLERIPPCSDQADRSMKEFQEGSFKRIKEVTKLQAIIIAWDCRPRILISHLPFLAASRGVPFLCIDDKDMGSKQLGKLLKLRGVAAIGIKAGTSIINHTIKEILKEYGNDGF